MALLPTIPTSFVPRMGGDHPHVTAEFGNAFAYFAYTVLGVFFLLAIGVFFYGRIQSGTLASKDAELLKQESSIDPDTVHGFVQLRDRLNASQTLLGNHVAPSGLFAALGTILPATVRFNALHVTIDTSGNAKVDGQGVAKSFNALSVASAAFASDGRIKNVIFSKMSINKDTSVSFGFSASVDPKLIAYSPSAANAAAPSTTTP